MKWRILVLTCFTLLLFISQVYADWEIESHTVTEADLTANLTDAELQFEIWTSKDHIEGNTTTLVYTFCPTGMQTNATINIYVTQEYWGQTTSSADDLNAFPWNAYDLHVKGIENTTSLATIKGWIDLAINQTNGEYLIIMIHSIMADVSIHHSFG